MNVYVCMYICIAYDLLLEELALRSHCIYCISNETTLAFMEELAKEFCKDSMKVKHAELLTKAPEYHLCINRHIVM